MQNEQLREIIHKHLKNGFHYGTEKVYCQVASTSRGVPHVRTMDLYEVTADKEVVLLTTTDSEKWSQLSTCPSISVCMANPNYGQLIVEGTCTLETFKTNPILMQHYWHDLLDDYWRQYYLELAPEENKETIPSSFGAIVVTPTLWEVLHFNLEDYKRSPRIQYLLLSNDQWFEKTLRAS